MNRRLAFWLAIFAGWTLLVIVFAVSSSLTYALTYQPPRWGYTLTMAATEWYVWAAFTPVVAWLSRRYRFSPQHWWRVPILAAAGVPVAFIKVTLTRILRGAIGGGDEYFQITDLVTQYLIYWSIVLAVHVWQHYRAAQQRELRTSQLEALLAQTRLQMLSMQLQPHFLFNTLNTIAELVHQQPEAAEKMIGGLSQLLRETLDAGAVDRVPLTRELEVLDHYIEIQRARFGERLCVDVTVDPAAREALVPSLLLQPLVENSIKHGIGTRAGSGRIEIAAVRDGGRLRIEVRDDGRGLREAPVAEGVGLGNCRSRLQALHGPAFQLDLIGRSGGGVTARIDMPFEVGA
jgi:two-component system, LytTR family, sensor kinase